MRMADVISEMSALAADITFRHLKSFPECKEKNAKLKK